MNKYHHKLQARRLSRTMDAGFCIEALKEAVASKIEPMKIAAQEQTLGYLKKTVKCSHK